MICKNHHQDDLNTRTHTLQNLVCKENKHLTYVLQTWINKTIQFQMDSQSFLNLDLILKQLQFYK